MLPHQIFKLLADETRNEMFYCNRKRTKVVRVELTHALDESST